jgi:AcrR family transcriptional regulator
MTIKDISTEDKILLASYDVFLLYGFHGTTIQQIASKAGVSKTSVHYYYRSKANLYTKVIEMLIEPILYQDSKINLDQHGIEEQEWFLITELHNNRKLFENTLKVISPDNFGEILKTIKNKVGIKVDFLED